MWEICSSDKFLRIVFQNILQIMGLYSKKKKKNVLIKLILWPDPGAVGTVPPPHDTKWLRYLFFDNVAIALLKVYNEHKRAVF